MSRPTTVPALAFVAVAGALLTAACASGSGGGSGASTPRPSAEPASFPITIRRSGGLAGFSDTVVVAQDGRARVATKSGTSTCTVTPEALEGLARTAAVGATASTASPSPGPDALVVTITTATGAVRLDEGDLPRTAPEVGALLEDLARPVADRTTCR